jgi:hypothetical protein
MRMSCNSTYLLDHETDHGVKADELAALFADLFADPEAKAVVFSQWTRTHDIVARRLDALGAGYVSFHGGIASDKRPELINRFRDDPDCRVFLSTDAGSTGLNLQHASTVVNMDLPWNPAVLEQRIARIHRMGQTRSVRVINFVAKGTIEEGMLSVLAFKRSLSAGVLDGGSGEIALGGSRLTRFMKDVENVTGRMGESEAVTPGEEAGSSFIATSEPQPAEDRDAEQPDECTVSRQIPPSSPWMDLMQMGAQFVAALAAANDPKTPPHPWIERDPATGTQSIRRPLPSVQATQQLANALSALAETLRGRAE